MTWFLFPTRIPSHRLYVGDMSRSSKSITSARLNDVILGCFGRLQPSDTLDHLVRYLGTWSGSELRIISSIDHRIQIKYLLQQTIHGEACIGFRENIFLVLSAGHPIHCETYRSFPATPCASPASRRSPWLSENHCCWRICKAKQSSRRLSKSLENLGSELLNLPRHF